MKQTSLQHKRVRMQDVASAAGVSSATVSYVMNGIDASIPLATRERVLATAQEMGYRANRMAQRLARQESGIIGLVVPNIEAPFFATLTSQLNRSMDALGYHLMFEVVDVGSILEEESVLVNKEQKAMLEAVDRLLEWDAAGLVIWLHRPLEPQELDRKIQPVPTVCMGTNESGGGICDYLHIDHYSGTRSAMAALIGMGHRKFCFVAPLKSIIDGRQRAVIDSLSEAGLEPPTILETEMKHCPARVQSILAEADAPTAFLCIDDHLAMATYSGIRSGRLRIPEDVSLISCDGGMMADLMVPRLSCVRLPMMEITATAITLLKERIAHKSAKSPDRKTIRPQYEQHQSTVCPQKKI